MTLSQLAASQAQMHSLFAQNQSLYGSNNYANANVNYQNMQQSMLNSLGRVYQIDEERERMREQFSAICTDKVIKPDEGECEIVIDEHDLQEELYKWVDRIIKQGIEVKATREAIACPVIDTRVWVILEFQSTSDKTAALMLK